MGDVFAGMETYNPEISKSPKRVMVIMSTYNGEKYIREQLDSIFKQEGVDLYCLVRDDGSSDATVSILEEYKNRVKERMDYLAGCNVGVVKSFGNLISLAANSDYEWIAFCDQDDVWKDNKLSNAIVKLENEKNQDIPLVYCSNLELVDTCLRPIGVMRSTIPRFNAYTALVQNCATGCTQVFNRKAAFLYSTANKTEQIEMHDYWMFLIGVYLGKVIYDDWTSMYYRQHSNNVIGASKKTVLGALTNISNGKSGNRERMVKAFIDSYESELDVKYRKILLNVVNYKSDLKAKVRLLFDVRYRGYSPKITLNFKFRVLVNALY